MPRRPKAHRHGRRQETTMPTQPLDQLPVTRLKGVGSQLADKLAKLDIRSVQDVLFHLPLRYLDRTRITPIGGLQPHGDVVVEGTIRACDLALGRRRSLVCKIQDNTGTLTLRFFHFSAGQQANLRPGTRLRCAGEARPGAAGLEMVHPEYQFIEDGDAAPLASTLTPVYPATEGITQQRLRGVAAQALGLLDNSVLPELVPADILPGARHGISLAGALRYLHQPPPEAHLGALADGEHPAQQRLAFEELLAHHLSLLRLRQAVRREAAPALPLDDALRQRFLERLPFPLTAAQNRVVAEIAADLANPCPMLRLVQGDVGSGKTVVAALATLAAVGNGFQAAIMAPTEILAEQHRASFEAWLAPLGIRIAWLTGKLKGKARDVQMAAIGDGSAQVVVGTHALFQEDVTFHRLGLAIIDEQHRFGVHQRLALRHKGNGDLSPHQLIMTATPIPRTLAMSAYADLDLSVIDQLPPGRTPVNTVAVSQLRRGDVIDRVRNACARGCQAYWVCTLIEESDVLEAQAAEATAAELHLMLPGVAIGLVHGRLKPAEKEQVMRAFKAGDIDLLVATTVIEVGVDVPNASLMVIENPERLGLAQLHQLRGRVGRGQRESHCVLLYGNLLSRQSKERIRILRESNDGFVIAEKDLALRGPGEVLGTRQTGELQLRIADLQRDADLLPEVKAAAVRLMARHPDNVEPLIRRWLRGNERFGQA
ncbi:MAG: ATP-dependent DNA helicase RecG [Porticoccaceae bacterium]